MFVRKTTDCIGNSNTTVRASLTTVINRVFAQTACRESVLNYGGDGNDDEDTSPDLGNPFGVETAIGRRVVIVCWYQRYQLPVTRSRDTCGVVESYQFSPFVKPSNTARAAASGTSTRLWYYRVSGPERSWFSAFPGLRTGRPCIPRPFPRAVVDRFLGPRRPNRGNWTPRGRRHA